MSEIEYQFIPKEAEDSQPETDLSITLRELIDEARRLMENTDGDPSRYKPCLEEIIHKCSDAEKALCSHKSCERAEDLRQTMVKAHDLIPDLVDHAFYWENFEREAIDATELLNSVRIALRETKPTSGLYSAACGEVLLRRLELLFKGTHNDVERLYCAMKDLDDAALPLRHLRRVDQILRSFAVDIDSLKLLYLEAKAKLSAELATEQHLERTFKVLANKILQSRKHMKSGNISDLDFDSLLHSTTEQLKSQKAALESLAQDRQYIESSTSWRLDRLLYIDFDSLLHSTTEQLESRRNAQHQTSHEMLNIKQATVEKWQTSSIAEVRISKSHSSLERTKGEDALLDDTWATVDGARESSSVNSC
ncbi:hypothetical protein Q1695_009828 [Nippostrongylus brasiliensis]|nr:hypothetical protein Q1695_009828 [Nippostrongylus brasiliensis]